MTNFVAAGTKREVAAFLSATTRSLAQLDTTAFGAECGIVQAEAAGRPWSIWDGLLMTRYGHRRPALGGTMEFASHTGHPSDAVEWAASHFVPANAAIVWHGPTAPRDLRLIWNHAGARTPFAPLPSTIPATPGWAVAGNRLIAMSFVAPATAGLRVVLEILEQRLRERMRTDQGLSYSTAVAMEPLGSELQHITIAADCLPESAVAATAAFVTCVEELLDVPPTEEETRRSTKRWAASIRGTAGDVLAAYGAATAHVLGAEPTRLAERRAELRDLTPQMVHHAFTEAHAGALLLVPDGVAVTNRRYTPDATGSSMRVRGTTFLPAGVNSKHRTGQRLVVGELGASLVDKGGRVVTVEAKRCAAVVKWDSNTRTLMGEDGFRLLVASSEWTRGQRSLAMVDETFADVPHIDLSGTTTETAAPKPQRSFESQARRAVLLTVYVIFMLGAIANVFDPPEGDSPAAYVVLAAVLAALGAVWFVPSLRARQADLLARIRAVVADRLKS